MAFLLINCRIFLCVLVADEMMNGDSSLDSISSAEDSASLEEDKKSDELERRSDKSMDGDQKKDGQTDGKDKLSGEITDNKGKVNGDIDGESTDDKEKKDQEIFVIQDTSFTVQISPPGGESFDLTVSIDASSLCEFLPPCL